MTADEVCRRRPEPGTDDWLFSGQLVERRNPNRYHSPGHAATVAKVGSLLLSWCQEAGNGMFGAYGYGCPYLLRLDPDTLVWFDASIGPRSAVNGPNDVYLTAAPTLAVEVMELDEDETLVDRLVRETLRHDVPEVWTIDPVDETITRHTTSGRVCCGDGSLELRIALDLPPLRCRVADIFE